MHKTLAKQRHRYDRLKAQVTEDISLTTIDKSATALCEEVFAGLSEDERTALKRIANGVRPVGSFGAVGRLDALALIEHDGQRIVLTQNGRIVVAFCYARFDRRVGLQAKREEKPLRSPHPGL